MKSQDVGILLKLICLQKHDQGFQSAVRVKGWKDWEPENQDELSLESGFNESTDPALKDETQIMSQYSVRSLAHFTGISKSQVNLALQRCFDVGLAKRDRQTKVPRANIPALTEFIIYGLRYVFPVKLGTITRGISTSLAAPVLESNLFSAGELLPVWPDARGKTKGQKVEPLFKSVTYAIRRDPQLYALLALVDAIRIGQPRERKLAIQLFKQHMENKD